MAFGIVQQVLGADGTSTSSTTATLTVTAITAGNCGMGFLEYAHATTLAPTSVKDNAASPNTYVQKNHLFDSTNSNGVVMFELPNVNGGGTVITATWSTGVTFKRIAFMEVSGVAAFDIANAQGAQTGATVSSPTVTPSQSGDFLFGVVANTTGGQADTFTQGTGWTIRSNGAGPNNNLADETQFPYNSVVAIASSFGVSQTTQNHYVGIMAFTAAVAAVNVPFSKRTRTFVIPTLLRRGSSCHVSTRSRSPILSRSAARRTFGKSLAPQANLFASSGLYSRATIPRFQHLR